MSVVVNVWGILAARGGQQQPLYYYYYYYYWTRRLALVYHHHHHHHALVHRPAPNRLPDQESHRFRLFQVLRRGSRLVPPSDKG